MNWKTLIIACSLSFIFATITVAGETCRTTSNMGPTTLPTPERPLFTAYRGVEIGTPANDARKKLGSTDEHSDVQETFKISDNESADLYYDSDRNVRAISVTFTGKLDNAPTPKAMFGENAEQKPDGGAFKRELYPKAGFWVSYTLIAGDEPMVIIAMQKM